MKNTFLFGLILFSVSACVDVGEFDPELSVIEGLRPIYAPSDWQEISSDTPKPIEKLGKIYYKDQVIYAVEQFKGIHVIDNVDPSNPTPIAFITIVGVRDLAIKGNIMYADNATDLVSLDITDIQEPVLKHRFENLYPNLDQGFPQGYQGPFECVESSESLIIGWETAMLEDPKCFR